MTCQNLGKLLSSFQNLTGETDERDLRTLIGDDDDAKALLKRCVFVEVRDHLINLELRKVYKDKQLLLKPERLRKRQLGLQINQE